MHALAHAAPFKRRLGERAHVHDGQSTEVLSEAGENARFFTLPLYTTVAYASPEAIAEVTRIRVQAPLSCKQNRLDPLGAFPT